MHDGRDEVLDGTNQSSSRCAEQVRIPVGVTLRSDDGALDEELAGDIWSEDLTRAIFAFEPDALPVSGLHGSFSHRLPLSSMISFSLSATLNDGEAGFYFAVYVDAEPDAARFDPLLSSFMPAAEACQGGVPRDSVLD